MVTFEILAFVDQDLYDGEDTNLSNVVEKFVAFYKLYFINNEIPNEYISFTSGKSFISYSVLLISEIIGSIKIKLENASNGLS
jgi:hypothetical protein